MSLLAVSTMLYVGFVSPVLAQTPQEIVCQHNPNAAECTGADKNTVVTLIDTVINVLSWIIGAVSVIVIIIAGFMYVASAGNPDTTKRAKNAIIYAIVGVVVAIFARIIVQFVLSAV